jgi:hypothetical protein
VLKKTLFAIILALVPAVAWAQSGQFTPGHAIRATTPQGVPFSDAGGAAGSAISGSGYLTELGVTATGTPVCINDALTNAPGGYHRFCIGANALGGGLISYDALAGAAPLGLNIEVNGTLFPFPGSGAGNVHGPSSSVVSNLVGFANTAGTLISDLGIPLVAIPHSAITMYPGPSVAPIDPTSGWTAFNTDGALISTAGTQTSGFQEVLAKLRTGTNPSLMIYGHGNTNDNVAIFGNSTMAVPYLRNQTLHSYGTAFGGQANTGAAISLDSMIESAFINEGGQIFGSDGQTATATSAAVLIAPTHAVQPENFSGIASSRLELGNLALNTTLGTATATLPIDLTGGSFVGNDLSALEVNCAGSGSGGVAQAGVFITAPTLNLSFTNNFIHMGSIHQCPTVGWNEGATAGQAANFFGNIEFFNKIAPHGGSAVGYATFGSNETVIANVVNTEGDVGTCASFAQGATNNSAKIDCEDTASRAIPNGVTLGVGATGNKVELTTKGTVTNAIVDNSATGHNSYTVNAQTFQEWKGGQQFNYLAPTSIVAGTGSAILSGSGNSFGSVNTGTAAPTTVAITFSISFVQNVTCRGSINQAGLWMVWTSAPSKTTATLTSKNSAGTTTAMPDNATVTYECWGQGN